MRKELFGALLLWVLNELLGRAFLHHHAAIHEHDAVGHVTGKVHLVGDDDHGGLAVGKVAQDAQHLAGQLRVEGRECPGAEPVRGQWPRAAADRRKAGAGSGLPGQKGPSGPEVPVPAVPARHGWPFC